MFPSSILRQKTAKNITPHNQIPPNMTRTRFNDEYYTDEISQHQEQHNPVAISDSNNLNENINSDDFTQNTSMKKTKGKDKKSMAIMKHIIKSLKQ
jgi:hypothetical protein